jgi:MFS family permease
VVDQKTSPAPTLERRRSALALLCAASFLAVVDTTIVSIALPSFRRVMGFSAGGSQWVLNAYALVFGGFGLGIVAAVVAATASQSAIDETALTSGFLTCLAFVVPALILVTIGSRARSPTTPDLREVSRSGGTTG